MAAATQGGGSAPPSFASWPALQAAYAAGRGVIAVIGDSQQMGAAAGTGPGGYTGAYLVSPSAFLITGLNGAGVTARDGYFGGSHSIDNLFSPAGIGVGTGAAFTDYDARFSSADEINWECSNGQQLDGNYIRNQTNGTALLLDPGFAYNRVLAMWGNYGTGTFNVTKSGVAVGATHNGIGPGASGYFNHDIELSSAALSSAPLSVARVADGAYIGPFVVWNSTEQHVAVVQLGVGGRTAQAWAAQNLGALGILGRLGPQLTPIQLGLNDKIAGRTKAQFKGDMQTIITAVLALGSDVLLEVPPPTGAFDIGTDYQDAIWELAASNSLQDPIDLYAHFVSYAASIAYYADIYHLNASGNEVVAGLEQERLLA